MITPSFSLTATERVLPKLALDFTTASLDSRVTFTRTTGASNPATYINSSGVLTAATNNQPRFDYDPSTLTCKGLLIEESRNNTQIYSEDVSNATYTKTNVTVSTDIYTAPDGNTTGDGIVVSTQTTVQGLSFTAFTADGTSSYSDSVFIKKTTGAGVSVIFVFRGSITSGTQYSQLTIDTTNGFTSFVASGSTSSAYSVTEINGWWRLTISAGGIPAGSMRSHVRLTSQPVNTQVGVWGCQHEVGAFATSYIPTTTTALTRNADVATMTGTNFSDWFNASEGALLAIGSRFGTSNVFPRLVQFDDGTDNNAMNVAIYGSNNNAQANVTASGSAQTSFSTISGGANVTMGVALAYKTDNFGCSANASSPQIDTSGTVPTVNRAIFGARPSGPVYLNGYIKKVMYWPQRLTQNELQAFSK